MSRSIVWCRGIDVEECSVVSRSWCRGVDVEELMSRSVAGDDEELMSRS